MKASFNKIDKIFGELDLGGDKSISHRAVFFSSMAEGISTIKNLSHSEDVKSTISCFQKLGAKIEFYDDRIEIKGRGFKNFAEPKSDLDAGNSGTTARLLMGVLSAQDFYSRIIGDESLSKRPMDRIANPLNKFGANIKTNNGKLPVEIFPTQNLKAFSYTLEKPSAQLKSAMILSAVHLEETSTIIESFETRNHTEQMLNLKKEELDIGKKIFASRKNYPVAKDYFIPSDISSAAFFIVLSLICPNSFLKIKNVSLNPTRTGLLEILRDMGANISIENENEICGEKFGDIIIQSSKLKNVKIKQDLIPNIIDEIPILSVAGFFAEGDFEVRGAKELRVKESDRIKAMVENFRKVGIAAEEFEDGFAIRKEKSKIKKEKIIFESYDDHRIAMSFAVFSSCFESEGEVESFDCVKISNPYFLTQMKNIAG